jgi:Na+-driven multidrug efflux pump
MRNLLKHYHEEIMLLKLSIPITMKGFSEILPWIITLAFVGHYLGTAQLSALSLMETYIYSFLVVSWETISMTASTLLSQAHGARNKHAMRTYGLMNLIVILAMTGLFQGPIVAAKVVLLGIGFDETLVTNGYPYALYCLPNLWIEAINVASGSYILAAQRPEISAGISFVQTVVDLISTYLLITRTNLGLIAGALGWTIGSLSSCLLNLVVIPWLLLEDREIKYGHEIQENEGIEIEEEEGLLVSKVAQDGENVEKLDPEIVGLSSVNLCRLSIWKTYFNQAGPNFAYSSLNQLQLQIMSFLAASLGPVDIAAHNTAISFFELMMCVTLGLGGATTTRIGHHLGRSDPKRAKQVALSSFYFQLGWSICAGIIGWPLQQYIGFIYSSDESVIDIISSLANVYWLLHGVVCLSVWGASVLEAQGRSTAELVAAVTGSWLVMLPIGVCFALYEKPWGIWGLWLAFGIGEVVTVLIVIWFVVQSDWEKLVDEARERIEETAPFEERTD